MATTAATHTGLHPNNFTLVVGELINDPAWRELPSGINVLSCSLRVAAAGAPATTVPVVWYDPPQRAHTWRAGHEVIVAGSVVRRFFRRGGGGLGSATEVVVAKAEPLSHRVRVSKLRSEVAALLGASDR